MKRTLPRLWARLVGFLISFTILRTRIGRFKWELLLGPVVSKNQRVEKISNSPVRRTLTGIGPRAPAQEACFPSSYSLTFRCKLTVLKKIMSKKGGKSKKTTENVKVCVRIRPLNKIELAEENEKIFVPGGPQSECMILFYSYSWCLIKAS